MLDEGSHRPKDISCDYADRANILSYGRHALLHFYDYNQTLSTNSEHPIKTLTRGE